MRALIRQEIARQLAANSPGSVAIRNVRREETVLMITLDAALDAALRGRPASMVVVVLA